jgi:hypothetical protein
MESNPGLRGEILEQRKARSEQDWEQRKTHTAHPVQAAPGLETLTLAEYARYVRKPMGKGFAGGGLELAALGKLTDWDVYLWHKRSTGWWGMLVTEARCKPLSEGIHLAVYNDHFNQLVWHETDAGAPALVNTPRRNATSAASLPSPAESDALSDRAVDGGYNTAACQAAPPRALGAT